MLKNTHTWRLFLQILCLKKKRKNKEDRDPLLFILPYFPFILFIPHNYDDLITFLPFRLLHSTSLFFFPTSEAKKNPKHSPYPVEYMRGVRPTWINITLYSNLTTVIPHLTY